MHFMIQIMDAIPEIDLYLAVCGGLLLLCALYQIWPRRIRVLVCLHVVSEENLLKSSPKQL